MRTIIYAHPYNKSFCNAIFNQVQLKDDKIIDLYQDHFNPVYSEQELSEYNKGTFLDPIISKYQKMLKDTDELIIITPIWWNNVPGILKGFFDKVFTKNFAYKDSDFGVKGKLINIKKATIITTSNSPVPYLKLKGINNNIRMTLKQIGVKKIEFKQFGRIKNSSVQQRRKFLEKIKPNI